MEKTFLKPLKLRILNESQKYGIAARNLREFIVEGCRSYKVPFDGAHVCLYEDGTEVTDAFFKTLPDNTELVLLANDQTWAGLACDIERILLSIDGHSDGVVEAAKKLLSGEQSSTKKKFLADLLQHLDDTSDRENREDDEDWFQDVDRRFKTKSSYMKYNCERRIRGYMKEVESVDKRTIKKCQTRREFEETVSRLKAMLKSVKYNGCYFDRSKNETERLCTRDGWFTCQGSFDQAVCESLHSINPYSSRASRIVFSTWNLDHRIEKKRTVIPTLLKALENHKSDDINLDYFYRLLFTTENLNLVHITCHNKAAHNLQCDRKRIYKQTRMTKSNIAKKNCVSRVLP